MDRVIPLILAFVVSFTTVSSMAADNVVLVTLDGLRWQEVFRGYDPELINSEKFTEGKEHLLEKYDGNNNPIKREKLMPFVWHEMAEKGVVIGNRDKNSNMSVTNPWWFSYPGYNEILTGRADPEINSNKAVANKNVTILEWLNTQSNFKGRVAAFGSWDVFPAIINAERAGIPVNAGFMPADWRDLSQRAKFLNELQAQVPSPWDNVRLDAFTYGFAKEYLLAHKPRVLYISLGETDDFAHDEQYHQYLNAANRADQLIADLWQTLQSIPQYRNNTNLIITVDHGRGQTLADWPHHASARAVKEYFKDMAQFDQGIVGADQIWFAAIGPDIKPLGEVSGGKEIYQDQVAATVLRALGIDPKNYGTDIGTAIEQVLIK